MRTPHTWRHLSPFIAKAAAYPYPLGVPSLLVSERSELLQQHIMRALLLRPGASAVFLTNVTGARRQAVDDALYLMLRDGSLVDRGSGRHHAFYQANSGAGPTSLLRGAALGLLNLISRGDGAAFADLVAETGLSKSEVSRLGSRLQEAGVVEPLRVGTSLFYVMVAS